MAENYTKLYELITENCKHQNPELKSVAFGALEAYLREVWSELDGFACLPI